MLPVPLEPAFDLPQPAPPIYLDPVVIGAGQPTARFVGRATGVLPGGRLQGQQAATAPLDAVVWATGFRPDYGWIELPVIGPDGALQHERGLTAAPGVAVLGLPWLDTRSSALLNGAGADARRIVAALIAGR